jgi:hypothetical protein
VSYEGNVAGAGVTNFTVSQNLEAMDGAADYVKGYLVDWTNADHSAGNVYGFEADLSAQDAQAAETAFKVTGGWDTALDGADLPVTNLGQVDLDTVNADGAALALGTGDETVAIASSDWDIDATGIATGMGAFTSDGAGTFASLNVLDGAITNVGDVALDSVSADTDNGPLYIGDTDDQPIVRLDGSPASDDTYSGTVVTSLNCGEAIAQWDLVYMDGTENEWMLADSNAAGKFPALGMAVAACTNGNEGTILVQGVVRNSGWSWTNEGVPLYLDETTAGSMTETAPSTSGDCVQHVARVLAVTDDTILFNPNTLWVEIN